jgi:hypothetical protein
MFKKFILSAILAPLLATTISDAIAAPKSKPKPTLQNNMTAQNNMTVQSKQKRSVPMSGAEWWQNFSLSEQAIGVRYPY